MESKIKFEFNDLINYNDSLINSIKSITDAVLYRIHQKSNDKNYIGVTRNLWKRLYKHYGYVTPIIKHNEKKYRTIHRAILEFGPEDFEFIIELTGSFDELDGKEKEYIELFDSYSNGYNMTPDGKGVYGSHYNEKPTIPKGYIGVTNGEVTKFVSKEEFDLMDKSEWSIGSTSKGLICITNGSETIRVRESELSEYLSKGYRKGLHYSTVAQ